jgi:hypothetical protein
MLQIFINSGKNQSYISNFNNNKHNTHKWDAGEVGLGGGWSKEQTHKITKNYLETHLSLNGFLIQSSQRQTSIKWKTSCTHPSHLHAASHSHTHSTFPQPCSKLPTAGSLAKACLVFRNCKHEIERGIKGTSWSRGNKGAIGWVGTMLCRHKKSLT